MTPIYRRSRSCLPVVGPPTQSDDSHSSDEAAHMAVKKNRTSFWSTNYPNRSSGTNFHRDPPRKLKKHATPIPKTTLDPFQPRFEVDFEKEMTLSTVTATSTASSQATSLEWEGDKDTYTTHVIYHGEAQTHGSLWSKSKEYLVLTDKYLHRCKSRNQAATVFYEISKQRRRHTHAQFSPSAGLSCAPSMVLSPDLSWDELPEQGSRIELNWVFAVYILRDSKPHFALALHWFNDRVMRPYTLNLVFQDPNSRNQWLTQITKQALHAGSQLANHLHWVQDEDLLVNDYTTYRIVKHVDRDEAGQSPNGDAQNGLPQLSFLAVGCYKIHFIPIRNFGKYESYGIATLTSVDITANDSRVKFTFRLPFQKPRVFACASVESEMIAYRVYKQLLFIRPNRKNVSLRFNLPQTMRSMLSYEEGHECTHAEAFERTLMAYCSAYGLNKQSLLYEIGLSEEGSPCFRLIPRTPEPYNALELLALMRSLRYTELCESMSFATVKLDSLNNRYDSFGTEHLYWSRKYPFYHTNPPYDLTKASLLVQEIAALAVTNRKLLRLDFSDTISTTSTSDDSCGILKALFPLCRQEVTNVEWLNLHGLHLTHSDMEYLRYIADDRRSHLHGLDLSKTHLGPQVVTSLLHNLKAQEGTFEMLNLSDNGACVNQCTFDSQIRAFPYMRVLVLCRLNLSLEIKEPLLSTCTLETWRLQELELSGTPVNRATVLALASYLNGSASNCLRKLKLDNTRLSGADIGKLLHAMPHQDGHPRNIQFEAGRNRLEDGHNDILLAIRNGWTPRSFSLAGTEYRNGWLFKDLLDSIRENTTIRQLDISKITLKELLTPVQSEKISKSIYLMIRQNWTLEKLDFSGCAITFEDNSIIDPNIQHLLSALTENKSLRFLDISHRDLFRGGRYLAEAIRENDTIQEIRCDDAHVSLEDFTEVVDAVEDNFKITFLSDMEKSKQASLGEFPHSFASRRSEKRQSLTMLLMSSVDRKLRDTRGKVPQVERQSLQLQRAGAKSNDEEITLAAWTAQQLRLSSYLARNKDIGGGRS